jgi:DNA-binding PadR family transcriptional regulator
MNITQKEEVIPLTPQAFHILLALAEKPMYIYGVVMQCQADAGTDIHFDKGSLYRTARRLQSMGYIEATIQIDGRGSSHARQYFALTPQGELVLKFECDRYRETALLGHHRLNLRHHP